MIKKFYVASWRFQGTYGAMEGIGIKISQMTSFFSGGILPAFR